MKKVPTIYVRDHTTKTLTYNWTPGCEWVFQNRGVPTGKFDGTACMIANGKLYKRFTQRSGKLAPAGFIEVDRDLNTGKSFGWVFVNGESKEDRWYREAIENTNEFGMDTTDGTYELVGPKINDNPHKLEKHVLWKHGCSLITDLPYPFDYSILLQWCAEHPKFEGIVWHHPVDGRMAKIKRVDFGLRWPTDEVWPPA